MEKEGKLLSVEAVVDAKGQAVNATVRDRVFGGPRERRLQEDVFEPKTNDASTLSGRPFASRREPRSTTSRSRTT